eukprot:gene8700-10220_t
MLRAQQAALLAEEHQAVKWQWKDDKGSYVDYKDDFVARLEKHIVMYGDSDFKVDSERYIDLKVFLQRRYDAPTKVRQVQRVVNGRIELPTMKRNVQVSKPTSSPYKSTASSSSSSSSSSFSSSPYKPMATTAAKPTIATKPTTPATTTTTTPLKALPQGSYPVWSWKSDDDWVDYKKETSQSLEDAYNQGKNKVFIDDERYVDIGNMAQKRLDSTSKMRPVRRLVKTGSNSNNNNNSTSNTTKPSLNTQQSTKQSSPPLTSPSQFQQSTLNMKPKTTGQPAKDIEQKGRGKWVWQSDRDYVPYSGEHNELIESAYVNGKPANFKKVTQPQFMEFDESVFEPSTSYDTGDDIELDDPDFEEKKRSLYACGDDYLQVDNIPSWYDFIEEKRAKFKPRQPIFTPNANINRKVSLFGGDITTLEIDAIVNAARPSLLGGGGIGPTDSDKNDLRSCYKTTLDLVLKHNIRTIAMCCVATGVYGFPNDQACAIALQVVRSWLEKNSHRVVRIIFCVFTKEDYVTYGHQMQSYFPVHPEGDLEPNDDLFQ